jgi:hypothetical protein
MIDLAFDKHQTYNLNAAFKYTLKQFKLPVLFPITCAVLTPAPVLLAFATPPVISVRPSINSVLEGYLCVQRRWNRLLHAPDGVWRPSWRRKTPAAEPVKIKLYNSWTAHAQESSSWQVQLTI